MLYYSRLRSMFSHLQMFSSSHLAGCLLRHRDAWPVFQGCQPPCHLLLSSHGVLHLLLYQLHPYPIQLRATNKSHVLRSETCWTAHFLVTFPEVQGSLGVGICCRLTPSVRPSRNLCSHHQKHVSLHAPIESMIGPLCLFTSGTTRPCSPMWEVGKHLPLLPALHLPGSAGSFQLRSSFPVRMLQRIVRLTQLPSQDLTGPILSLQPLFMG